MAPNTQWHANPEVWSTTLLSMLRRLEAFKTGCWEGYGLVVTGHKLAGSRPGRQIGAGLIYLGDQRNICSAVPARESGSFGSRMVQLEAHLQKSGPADTDLIR